MESLTLVSSNACFGGSQKVFSHNSTELKCQMKFAIYIPPQADCDDINEKKLPIIWWLSGLTCNEQNFIMKAGAQRYAAEHGLIIVCPDTSPRDVNIPGEDESYDFGSGAGFYLDAALEPWKENYRMFSYITQELNDVVTSAFVDVADASRQSIMGHSMGGHGAMVCALKNPGLYKSVSAFAPICNPINCPWGIKAFTGYLGPNDQSNWAEWDTVELVKNYNGPPISLFVDQGKSDNFYVDKQLLPENLTKACCDSQFQCVLKLREGYDHSYYFIASFIGEHLDYHAKILNV